MPLYSSRTPRGSPAAACFTGNPKSTMQSQPPWLTSSLQGDAPLFQLRPGDPGGLTSTPGARPARCGLQTIVSAKSGYKKLEKTNTHKGDELVPIRGMTCIAIHRSRQRLSIDTL